MGSQRKRAQRAQRARPPAATPGHTPTYNSRDVRRGRTFRSAPAFPKDPRTRGVEARGGYVCVSALSRRQLLTGTAIFWPSWRTGVLSELSCSILTTISCTWPGLATLPAMP